MKLSSVCGDETATSYISEPRATDTRAAESAGRAIRVAVLGDDEVGKTALLQQFMTSAYMAAAVQTHFGMNERQKPSKLDIDCSRRTQLSKETFCRNVISSI